VKAVSAAGDEAHAAARRALAARQHYLVRRAQAVQAVRAFFCARDVLEVETPVRMRAPLPERYIDAVPSGDAFLATSPEPHMKRLLAAGYQRIFQISKCFRHGERGRLHHPEFTMLEWYRAGADCAVLIDDVRALLQHVCRAVHGTEHFVFRGVKIALDAPWEMLSVDEAFARYAGRALEDTPDQAWFEETLVAKVEPQLGREAPAVLHGYPAAFCPMARTLAGAPHRAERCEVYIAGIELANGCAEETDAARQAAALRAEQALRAARGAEVYPWPDDFIAALPHLPPCAGMALGIDRLVMLLCDAACVADVIAFCE